MPVCLLVILIAVVSHQRTLTKTSIVEMVKAGKDPIRAACALDIFEDRQATLMCGRFE